MREYYDINDEVIITNRTLLKEAKYVVRTMYSWKIYVRVCLYVSRSSSGILNFKF